MKLEFTLDCHSGGRGFESRRLRHLFNSKVDGPLTREEIWLKPQRPVVMPNLAHPAYRSPVGSTIHLYVAR